MATSLEDPVEPGNEKPQQAEKRYPVPIDYSLVPKLPEYPNQSGGWVSRLAARVGRAGGSGPTVEDMQDHADRVGIAVAALEMRQLIGLVGPPDETQIDGTGQVGDGAREARPKVGSEVRNAGTPQHRARGVLDKVQGALRGKGAREGSCDCSAAQGCCRSLAQLLN